MLRIRVNGQPAPQGSKTRGRNGGLYEASKKVGPWRDAVRTETQQAIAGEPFGRGSDPAAVRIRFYLPRPAGHYGSGRNRGRLRAGAPRYPAARPDLDKLCRSTLDGLAEGGAFTNDGQVVELTASKHWADECPPGATIELETR